MNLRIFLRLVTITMLVASCAGTVPPPPAPGQRGENPFLIDPRIGYKGAADSAVEKRFDAAWRSFTAGNLPETRRRLADLRARAPQYLPAALVEAAVDLREGNLAAARTIVQRVEQAAPDFTAARVYDAEIAIAEGRARAAYDIYRSLDRAEAPPTVADRIRLLQTTVFEQLYSAAQTAPDEEAIRLLREALSVNAGATDARLLLANKLIARRAIEEANQILQPLVASPEKERPDVQQALAEIEVGRGQYQEAIARYDRLSRRDPRFTRRLEEVKQRWSEANMPPQYQRAIASNAIDRSDLAVLTYWTVTSVRFAQNLGIPPIAIDMEGIPGREEIIRAIAVGLYEVDPVTRRVSPLRPVSATSLTRFAARLLTINGAACARVQRDERDDMMRARGVLAACRVSDPLATLAPESPVSGRMARTLISEIERVLPH